MKNHEVVTPRLICISGGIGSGKSVVCRLLETMGYEVYDCDTRAKQIMDSSDEIKRDIAQKIATDAVAPDGKILRDRLAKAVFSDSNKLSILNSLVHTAIRKDIVDWKRLRTRNAVRTKDILFVESAIPFTADLHTITDAIWEVTAPEPLRIARIVKRNNCSAEDALARIESQKNEEYLKRSIPHKIQYIVNDNTTSIIEQVLSLLKEYLY